MAPEVSISASASKANAHSNCSRLKRSTRVRARLPWVMRICTTKLLCMDPKRREALPIHDALQQFEPLAALRLRLAGSQQRFEAILPCLPPALLAHIRPGPLDEQGRSEEHTSELQSRPHLVCRLLLAKKKNTKQGQQVPVR